MISFEALYQEALPEEALKIFVEREAALMLPATVTF
jgi:hypothetical protein